MKGCFIDGLLSCDRYFALNVIYFYLMSEIYHILEEMSRGDVKNFSHPLLEMIQLPQKRLPVIVQLPLGHGQAAAQPGQLPLRRVQPGRRLGGVESGLPPGVGRHPLRPGPTGGPPPGPLPPPPGGCPPPPPPGTRCPPCRSGNSR